MTGRGRGGCNCLLERRVRVPLACSCGAGFTSFGCRHQAMPPAVRSVDAIHQKISKYFVCC